MDVGRERDVDRVEVSDPAHDGGLAAFGEVRGQMRRENALLRDFDLFQAELAQFFGKEFGKAALPFGARDDPGLGVALRGHGHVAQKAFKKLFLHFLSLFLHSKR